MKYKIQKLIIENTIWFQILLFAGLVLFLLYYFYYPNKLQVEGFIGICVTILSLIYTFNTSYFDNKKIFKELFDSFNTKYDSMNEGLNELVNDFKNLNKENKFRALNKEEKKLINDYLNLCAEEYYWFTRGLIDKEVWNNWFAGICYFLKQDFYREKIIKEKKEPDSYYKFLIYYEANKNRFNK